MTDYCTIQDGAGILKVSRPTVYKLIAESKLGVYKVLGRPALKVTEVNEVAKQRKSEKQSNGNSRK